MNISYNWLKQYINIDLPAEKVAELLTDCGLEVEAVEKWESVPGGLAGLVIGEVKTKIQHPNADRLSVCTVDIGTGTLLNIVCGAPNVAAGQKVVVAPPGTVIRPLKGEPFEIKKTKIRGEASEGMICAEDEISLGASHDGIIVLDSNAKTGSSVREYYQVEEDSVFVIGLTPNRSDAASHIGVARDLFAVISNNLISHISNLIPPSLPSVNKFSIDNKNYPVDVIVEDPLACPRYSGITISGVQIKESPAWLKNRIASIGLKPISNVVDITNFVLHELGQPLHAFDADEIQGKKVIVKKLAAGSKFITLDEVERTLSGDDLMICDAQGGMCIAGVFGGISSGIKQTTKNIFLESACFGSVSIRKTSKHHGLKTDAAFRFERGTDPNITVYALKRAAMLIKELAGGTISSDIVDVYPKPVPHHTVELTYRNTDRLAGIQIDRKVIRNILTSLGIEVKSESSEGMVLAVPPYKVDVTREADVIEEILRIYGYNNIPVSSRLVSSLSFSIKPDREKVQNVVSDYLTANGFFEILSTSLTKSGYTEELQSFPKENNVPVLNPLSSDLDVLRQSLLFSGLEAIAWNRNRQHPDLKFFEFGKSYHKAGKSYDEPVHLFLSVTGRRNMEGWNAEDIPADFYHLKAFVQHVLTRAGINSGTLTLSEETGQSDLYSSGVTLTSGKEIIAVIGKVKNSWLKQFDITAGTYCADIAWDKVIALSAINEERFRELPKFPEARRDLSMVLDKSVKFADLHLLAGNTGGNLLREINLFDVYEGDKIESGKKSYAVSFILQDDNKTLTDSEIDKVMDKLMKSFEKNLNAVIRK